MDMNLHFKLQACADKFSINKSYINQRNVIHNHPDEYQTYSDRKS